MENEGSLGARSSKWMLEASDCWSPIRDGNLTGNVKSDGSTVDEMLSLPRRPSQNDGFRAEKPDSGVSLGWKSQSEAARSPDNGGYRLHTGLRLETPTNR